MMMMRTRRPGESGKATVEDENQSEAASWPTQARPSQAELAAPFVKTGIHHDLYHGHDDEDVDGDYVDDDNGGDDDDDPDARKVWQAQNLTDADHDETDDEVKLGRIANHKIERVNGSRQSWQQIQRPVTSGSWEAEMSTIYLQI